ncbi:hypothetical protein CDAR_487071 [Caerostris darwini]|uniref:Uncharacterized protein n=1 Tax=Caerostris darwini TaxID=1538125 RepID=A0AAV4TFJ2_9ARAC|nr:hypothetical protein CDAR_487071 [Caerostris darwini]
MAGYLRNSKQTILSSGWRVEDLELGRKCVTHSVRAPLSVQKCGSRFGSVYCSFPAASGSSVLTAWGNFAYLLLSHHRWTPFLLNSIEG